MATLKSVISKFRKELKTTYQAQKNIMDVTDRYLTELENAETGGGSDVTVTQVVSTGTKIASIKVDDDTTDLYAPAVDISGKADKIDLTDIIETGTEASQAIAAGTYFYLNGTLCRAKTDIAAGATFTLNTNYEVVNGALNDTLPSWGIQTFSLNFTALHDEIVLARFYTSSDTSVIIKKNASNYAIVYCHANKWMTVTLPLKKGEAISCDATFTDIVVNHYYLNNY